MAEQCNDLTIEADHVPVYMILYPKVALLGVTCYAIKHLTMK